MLFKEIIRGHNHQSQPSTQLQELSNAMYQWRSTLKLEADFSSEISIYNTTQYHNEDRNRNIILKNHWQNLYKAAYNMRLLHMYTARRWIKFLSCKRKNSHNMLWSNIGGLEYSSTLP